MKDYKEIADELETISDSIRKNEHLDESCTQTIDEAVRVIKRHTPSTEKRGYPYNLLSSVGIYYNEIDDDILNGIKKALSTLTPMEQIVIGYIFKEDYSVRETAEHFGISTERARQKMYMGLRKLRHPSRLNLMLYGENEYNSYLKAREKLAERKKELEDERAEIIKRYTDTRKTDTAEDIEKAILNTPVEDLGFSTRTKNCLLRCNINTLYDITETTRRNISRVRNMGDKGVKEVDDKLKEYGLHFKAEEIQ